MLPPCSHDMFTLAKNIWLLFQWWEPSIYRVYVYVPGWIGWITFFFILQAASYRKGALSTGQRKKTGWFEPYKKFYVFTKWILPVANRQQSHPITKKKIGRGIYIYNLPIAFCMTIGYFTSWGTKLLGSYHMITTVVVDICPSIISVDKKQSQPNHPSPLCLLVSIRNITCS